MLKRIVSWVPALAASSILILLALLARYKRRVDRASERAPANPAPDEQIMRWLLVLSGILLALFAIYVIFGTFG